MCIAITLGVKMDNTAIVPAGGRDDDNTGLLSDLDALRRRTRDDRHGYAFTLLLFGVLILAAPLLYKAAPYFEGVDADAYDPKVLGDNPLVQIFRTTAGQDPAHPTLIALYWLAVLVAGFGATVWWYRSRAARVGVETDTRGLIITGVAAFAGFFLSSFVFSRNALSLYGEWEVNLSLMFGSLAAVALILWRMHGPFGVFLASVFGTVTFSSIAVYTNKGFSALLVIAAGLLILAWVERSMLLGVVSVLFTLAAVPATVTIYWAYLYLEPAALFYHLGWQSSFDLRVFVLQQMLLPGMILIIGGTVAAVKYRRKEVT
jgi:hypothetical protein